MKKLMIALFGVAAMGVACSSKPLSTELGDTEKTPQTSGANTNSKDTGTTQVDGAEPSGQTGGVGTTGQTSMVAKQVAVGQEANFVTEFSFAKGSSQLSEANKNKLRSLLDSARKNRKVDDIKVVTWGDSEYPSVHTGKLAKADVDLVAKRNLEIQNFLEAYNKDFDVELFSMAERPNALEKLFGTSDARIKKSLETAGIPNTDTMVKRPSKSSKSIVMIIVE